MTEPSRKEEKFAETMIRILNGGAVNLAMGIGYRLGLFDVMDELDGPKTSAEIAHAADLSERYVREWLGVMVCAGVMDLMPGDGIPDRFHLPKAHADLLTRRADHANMGVYAQEIPLLTQCSLEAVVSGFRTGDGVAYENYPCFQNFMSELAVAKHRRMLVNIFLPSVAGGEMVKKLTSGIRVCDVGCAEGVALLLMAEAFPASIFVGMDIDDGILEKARAAGEGRANLSFLKRDAATLAGDSSLADSFDYVTAFDAIHDQTRPLDALKGIHAILKSGGAFSMVDIAAGSRLSENVRHPLGSFLYTVSLMHCMPVGLVDGGSGLGMMWGREKAVDLLRQAGFGDIAVTAIPEDAFNLHFFCRKAG